MSRLRNYLLASISLLLCSCAKAPFSNGVVKQETRQVPGIFHVLEMNDDVDVSLVHQPNLSNDTTTKVALEVNENLLENIITKIHGDTLTISNDNHLEWIRPYNSTIKATVYYDSITTIIYNSNGRLDSDIIHSDDGRIDLQVEGGSGDINLHIDCERIHTNYEWGTATVKLHGNVTIAYTSTSYNCHGPIDAQELETNYHYIYSYGTNKVIAKAFTEIDGTNGNNGIICYVRYHTIRDEMIWGHYNEDNIWVPAQMIQVNHSCPKRIVYHGPGPEETTGLDSIVIQ